MLTLVLSQVFAFFPEYDVVLNESTHDCGVIIVIRPNPKDIDSACEASGMLSFWVISYCCALLFLSVVIPSCLFLYENTSSLLYPLLRWIVVLTRTFSYKCSRVVIFLCIVLGSVGVVCLLAAAYYFLEKDASVCVLLSQRVHARLLAGLSDLRPLRDGQSLPLLALVVFLAPSHAQRVCHHRAEANGQPVRATPRAVRPAAGGDEANAASRDSDCDQAVRVPYPVDATTGLLTVTAEVQDGEPQAEGAREGESADAEACQGASARDVRAWRRREG